MNHYEALEVSPKASPEVLRAAYKSLIQRYHPDRNPGDETAALRSRRVVEAYQVLSDTAKRAAYDQQLSRQQANHDAAAPRPRAAAAAPARRPDRGSHWLLWPVTGVVVLTLWFFWSAFDNRPPAAANSPKSAPPAASDAATEAPTGLRGVAPDTSARTIPNFLENLQVSVVAPARAAGSADASSPAAPITANGRYVLSIKSVGLVLGGFDPDKFVALLEGNKDYIGRQLQQRLAQANPTLLGRESGERYLKQYLLDALGEITNTDRLEKYALPGSPTAAHYGAVEILLPDSFSFEPEAQPAVLR